MKVLIVDDEPPARDRLCRLLEEDGQHEVVGEAGNGAEALELAARLNPDAILLDIRMPGMNGIETARHLNESGSAPAVVFTTAYDEYAIEAFEANAIGYVLKPVRRERLDAALKQAARLNNDVLVDTGLQAGLPGQRRHVCSRIHGELKLIPVTDIWYFVADQKYVTVVHENGSDLIDDSLKSLEAEFADRFVRIHRSAMVAVDAIETLKKDASGRTRVILRAGTGDEELFVSRRHVADLKRRLILG
jgi:two-component system response regulator AlgR